MVPVKAARVAPHCREVLAPRRTTTPLLLLGASGTLGRRCRPCPIGGWWAPALALTVVVSQAIWAMLGMEPREGLGAPLQASNFVPVTVATALVIGAGVGARKAVVTMMAGATRKNVPSPRRNRA